MRQVRNDGMAVSSERMAWQALRLFSRIGSGFARIIVDLRKCVPYPSEISCNSSQTGVKWITILPNRALFGAAMHLRFHLDPETQQPHIYDHGVTEDEVKEVLDSRNADDVPGGERSRVRFGQTANGRYLKVIYVPDEDGDGAFVITAYDPRPKAVKAFRRRRRRKRK
jgi:hypothetical protein